MLEQIPPEIISHIAYHLCLFPHALTTSTPPIALLQTCKTIYQAIAPERNIRLYARIYRGWFDVAAAERRLGNRKISGAPLGTGGENGNGNKRKRNFTDMTKGQEGDTTPRLRAQDLVDEMKRRVKALARLREMVERGDVTEVPDDDLWVLYFMLIENDGKNAEILFGDQAIVHLPTFLELYHRQHFLAAAMEPGYPEETIGRSLAMWIAWFVLGSGPDDETVEQREERQFVLRPYVFAAPRYDAYFAPWTLPTLPLKHVLASSDESNPYIADLVPRSRLVQAKAYGRQLNLCPPNISQAAILRFFYRRVGEEVDETTMAAPFMGLRADGPGGGGGGSGVSTRVHSTSTSLAGSGTTTPVTRQAFSSCLPPSFSPPLFSSSLTHDLDFARLSLCYDPMHTPGMPRPTWRGSFEGCWEGTFSFFDFDAFREMLGGQARALYEGPYGEQAQVWKIKETWVRKQGWVRKERKNEKGKRKAEQEEEEGNEEEDHEEDEEELGRSPVSGPMLNAGFPIDQVTPPFPVLAPFAAEAATLHETMQQQLEAMEGYEAVPEHELDEMMRQAEEDGDGGEGVGLELLLTGTGHSAWGNFILKGRVRAWDGMASLVKEYAPDSRGKWIYRGYVLAGDILVGRWRDTYTPEAYVGYEGTFILNRR
ncbi:hypothetical protein I312_103536 [Cryptococcus bacillisporus CA1280]|uniref:F-box domain-containing protein n=2 Tax=Cryptococcus gattii TaxID=552467 RepID=A0A0D0VPR2_CRYGA|nr:hypothetical protein I312_03486 [Cryptococcus bacillisporus CA1280]KIR60379.1 hypothetical protein I314_03672 [Cryptococcus bacillisporus CA1873]|eukprot:KIR60379.1 hypothetical protein I314_03672 [Cryptococcus gattii CA1873]